MSGVLADQVSGAVLGRDDAGYAAEIGGFNLALRHTPDLVVAAESAADVVEAVRFAGAAGHRVGVHATGHSEVPLTGGLLVSTRRLDQVSVDPATGTATAGGGAIWGTLIAAAAEHGLFPIPGAASGVGVVGYLLGGGLGPLARSHGFSSDYLIRLTVVTGEGELVEASPTQHPDLFWALRGGKAGLGVVTEVQLRLVRLTTLYAGSLLFAEEHIEAALRGWADWTAGADPLVTTSVAIIRFPPIDAIPEPLRGRRLLSLRFVYPGPVEQGARLAEPLRSAAPVYLDGLGELPAAEIARVHNDPTAPAPAWARGALLDGVDQDLVSALLAEVGPGTDPPFIAAEIRHIAGAVRQDVEGGSAVGGRTAAFTFSVVGNPDAFKTELPTAADRLINRLGPWLSPVHNINFLGAPTSARHLASAWPADTFARLAEVRRRYDPKDVLASPFQVESGSHQDS